MGDLGWASEDLGLDKALKTRFDGYTVFEEQATVLALDLLRRSILKNYKKD